jgi:outer membrane protein OmpA-like peptidoglycan-associated protein
MSMTRTAVLVIGILLAPGGKLTIDGHTDNIGGDVKNLDLSRPRAEAVRRALVEQYHPSIGLKTTSGNGASRPVDSNDTLATGGLS